VADPISWYLAGRGFGKSRMVWYQVESERLKVWVQWHARTRGEDPGEAWEGVIRVSREVNLEEPRVESWDCLQYAADLYVQAPTRAMATTMGAEMAEVLDNCLRNFILGATSAGKREKPPKMLNLRTPTTLLHTFPFEEENARKT